MVSFLYISKLCPTGFSDDTQSWLCGPMRKANGSVWHFRTSALLLTTIHPPLFTAVHYSPRELWDQKPPYPFVIPNWWYQQGIWKFEGLENNLKLLYGILFEFYYMGFCWFFFLPFWPTLSCIRSQNPSHCPHPPGANSEHFSSLRDRPRKTKPPISDSIPHLLLSLEFQFHVWRIILSLTLGISRERDLPSPEWPYLLVLTLSPFWHKGSEDKTSSPLTAHKVAGVPSRGTHDDCCHDPATTLEMDSLCLFRLNIPGSFHSLVFQGFESPSSPV